MCTEIVLGQRKNVLSSRVSKLPFDFFLCRFNSIKLYTSKKFFEKGNAVCRWIKGSHGIDDYKLQTYVFLPVNIHAVFVFVKRS